jgi:superfamily I DNA and RNA helicase
MLEVVIGRGKNVFGQQQLLGVLRGADFTGTLYLAYPIIASSDQMIVVDSLLTCLEHGVVVVDFLKSATENPDLVRERQDELYTSLQRKLLQYKPLLKGRKLAVDINVITFAPDESVVAHFSGVDIGGPETLLGKLGAYSAISASDLKMVNAAIQRVATMKPTTKRTNVTRADSRGAIMQKIEREIANLDQWQKRGAIETPDGPQRIRGLAGSGKTIVLALKAAYLHTANPDWDIIVTFNTRALYQQFRDLIRRFCFEHTEDEPDWSKLKIRHAWGSSRQPGVYSEIAQASDSPVRDFTYAKSTFTYDTAFEGVCDELLHSLKTKPNHELYDAVLIDEAQDLPRSFFEICYIAAKDPKRIVYAYDELQNLGSYSMAPPAELFGTDQRGAPNVPNLDSEEGLPRRDIVLPICYRNTPWTLTTAHAIGFGIYRQGGLVQFFEDSHLLEEVGYRVRSGALDPGNNVELERGPNSYPAYFPELLDKDDVVQWLRFDNHEQQADWIAQQIQTNISDDELKHTDILVVIPNALTQREQSSAVLDALTKVGISGHLAGVTSSVDSLYQDGSIAITGIYRAKGNEAAMVYILNSQYVFSPFVTVRARNVLFTAITRSRAWVRLCGVGEGMTHLMGELEKVKQHDFRLSFRVPTDQELKRMRKIHRDMTDSEIAKQKGAIKNIEQLLAMAEAGELIVDMIPDELKKRLGSILEQDNDAE